MQLCLLLTFFVMRGYRGYQFNLRVAQYHPDRNEDSVTLVSMIDNYDKNMIDNHDNNQNVGV